MTQRSWWRAPDGSVRHLGLGLGALPPLPDLEHESQLASRDVSPHFLATGLREREAGGLKSVLAISVGNGTLTN